MPKLQESTALSIDAFLSCFFFSHITFVIVECVMLFSGGNSLFNILFGFFSEQTSFNIHRSLSQYKFAYKLIGVTQCRQYSLTSLALMLNLAHQHVYCYPTQPTRSRDKQYNKTFNSAYALISGKKNLRYKNSMRQFCAISSTFQKALRQKQSPRIRGQIFHCEQQNK